MIDNRSRKGRTGSVASVYRCMIMAVSKTNYGRQSAPLANRVMVIGIHGVFIITINVVFSESVNLDKDCRHKIDDANTKKRTQQWPDSFFQ